MVDKSNKGIYSIMFIHILFMKLILKVIGSMVVVIVMSAFMRLKYLINPSSKKKDLEKLAISKNGKYDPDPEDVTTNYLWTWKMISKRFKVLLQDINKVNINSSLYNQAINNL